MENIKICAVIITFNPDLILLSKEYYSIINQVEYIYYVDNNSNNYIKLNKWAKDKKKSSFIWLDKNEGIGVAQNHGIKASLKYGATHIVIFDQDSVVEPNFINSMLETEKKAILDGYNVGITAPVFFSTNDNYAYPIFNIVNNQLLRIYPKTKEDYFCASHVIASGELIRAEVFHQIGFMREDLFIGYIDFEFCFRATKCGFAIIVSNRSVMHHKIGDRQLFLFNRKIGLYSPFRRYFDCRNTILIQKDDTIPKVLAKYYLKLLPAKILISFFFGPKRIKQLKFCFKGIFDGLRGYSGYCSIQK